MAKRTGSSHFTVLFLSTVLMAGAACGGDDDETNVDGGGGGGSDAGAGGGGAGEDDGGDDGGDGACTEEPCLDPPAEGFQVRSEGGEILPGEDVEYCEVVQLPGTPDDIYYVNGFQSVMTRGSHHLIVSAVIPGSDTDKNTTVGDRVECITGSVWGDDLTDVTGQQLPEHQEAFPAGVGKVFVGGQKVIFDYHYFNATDKPLQARAAVNFLTTASENIEHEAQGFSKLNLAIFIPPMQESEFPDSCRMNRDVMVHKLTRHTHQWGTDFPVSLNRGEGEPELIYTSPNYEDPDFIFEEPILVREGEGFDFVCNYNNDTMRTLTFGVNATDEMCILFGSMYSPTERVLPPGTACE
jgi:Copper type II ascorbate-dependent monooxygenase, C-terminal domain